MHLSSGGSAPFTYPVDVEVLADREADLEALFAELHEEDARAEEDREPQSAGAS